MRPARRARCASLRVSSSLSAWTATGNPSRAARSMPSSSVRSSAAGNSSTPLADMNALKPTTPRAASSSSRSGSPGTSPPQSATSTCAAPSAARALASNAAPSTVGGIEFSGMSIALVVPPAASALVPVAKPSQCERPGSFRCTWASTTPGRASSPARVDLLRAARQLGTDRHDPPLRHRYVGACAGDLRAADDEVGAAHASRRRKPPSTSSATATSAGSTDSAGSWLTPPAQRTNSIAVPVSSDSATAS